MRSSGAGDVLMAAMGSRQPRGHLSVSGEPWLWVRCRHRGRRLRRRREAWRAAAGEWIARRRRGRGRPKRYRRGPRRSRPRSPARGPTRRVAGIGARRPGRTVRTERDACASSMPGPSSTTVMVASRSSRATVTTDAVPSGQCVRTLLSRLSTTWRNRRRSSGHLHRLVLDESHGPQGPPSSPFAPRRPPWPRSRRPRARGGVPRRAGPAAAGPRPGGPCDPSRCGCRA